MKEMKKQKEETKKQKKVVKTTTKTEDVMGIANKIVTIAEQAQTKSVKDVSNDKTTPRQPDGDKAINTSELLISKLNRIIELIEGQGKNETDISKMSISELAYLIEHLTRNITINNYPGGDNELKVSSNNLIIKISDEINNRIKLYH